MAIAGRPQKPPGQSVTRHAPTYAWVEVEDTPYEGPSLDLPVGNRQWTTGAEAWWAVVRAMPHCRLWAASDWSFALETAVLVNDFWSGDPSPALAAQLNSRYVKLGITYEDRLKLRIRYVAPRVDEKPGPVRPSARERLRAV